MSVTNIMIRIVSKTINIFIRIFVCVSHKDAGGDAATDAGGGCGGGGDSDGDGVGLCVFVFCVCVKLRTMFILTTLTTTTAATANNTTITIAISMTTSVFVNIIMRMIINSFMVGLMCVLTVVFLP